MGLLHMRQPLCRTAPYPDILACWNSEESQRSLVGTRPLHLANARPFSRLKAPLELSLLCNRDILISEENKKSEPFSYREKVRIFIVWCE